jgi:N-glycosylase/DNA lyase
MLSMVHALTQQYAQRRDPIRKRLWEFSRFYSDKVSWFYNDGQMTQRIVDSDCNQRFFEEMCFCILAANGSAASSMKAVDAARDILLTGSKDEIQAAFKESGVRFHNRAEYIVHNRENLRKEFAFDIKGLIESHKDKKILRNFLATYIKGFGFKEASHFLRNMGFKGLAILDKHILRSMRELGYVQDVPKSLTPKRYLDLEERYFQMSLELGIDPDELDLLLWSIKNGEIMK